ncbi:MAG: hypothetical protein IJW20_06820 [Clostridia bacterium]|nr:hypothetical protein [Clostridia bacterium]
MKKTVDYINLMSIAKENLNAKINFAMEKYKLEKTKERKMELIYLIEDRKQLFLFDKNVISKYL